MMDKFKIKNLDLYYGDFQALKNINMSIPANEITAFIGPSGCGKSTLLKSLNRMNDLVDLDQDGVGNLQIDALCQALGIGYE
jgi:phosphate transport system ATP-binding protein